MQPRQLDPAMGMAKPNRGKALGGLPQGAFSSLGNLNEFQQFMLLPVGGNAGLGKPGWRLNMTKNTGGSLGGGKGAGRATGGTKAGSSAGGRHGSASTDKSGAAVSGLQESSGEFRVGEKIVFGMRNGNVLIRHSPQGDEVEVGEATLAGLMIDAFFTDKFGGKDGDYPPINKQG